MPFYFGTCKSFTQNPIPALRVPPDTPAGRLLCRKKCGANRKYRCKPPHKRLYFFIVNSSTPPAIISFQVMNGVPSAFPFRVIFSIR